MRNSAGAELMVKLDDLHSDKFQLGRFFVVNKGVNASEVRQAEMTCRLALSGSCRAFCALSLRTVLIARSVCGLATPVSLHVSMATCVHTYI